MSKSSDSSSATKSSNAVKYQGRKASRAGSEQRRRLILEAALRIVVREGVRGIRHRAVAKEADVPLAATTYYFKDIEELINDTFTLYAEQALGVVNHFSTRLFEPAANDQGHNFTDLFTNSEAMAEVIADKMTQYVVEQVTDHRDSLIAEQAFRYEAILSPRLRTLGRVHKESLMKKLIEILGFVKSPNPLADANIIIAILHRLEYECLLIEPEEIDAGDLRNTLLRELSLILNSRD